MILRAKILPKYLDEILRGKKSYEYREIEGIELDDGKRKITFEVLSIDENVTIDFLKKHFPDIKWGKSPKIRIWIGNKISEVIL